VKIDFNVDGLTLGQIEFLEDFSHLTIEEIMAYAEGKPNIPFRLTMAMIAITASPDDPAGNGLMKARQYKVSDLDVGE
jgi:hypothetical protein